MFESEEIKMRCVRPFPSGNGWYILMIPKHEANEIAVVEIEGLSLQRENLMDLEKTSDSYLGNCLAGVN